MEWSYNSCLAWGDYSCLIICSNGCFYTVWRYNFSKILFCILYFLIFLDTTNLFKHCIYLRERLQSIVLSTSVVVCLSTKISPEPHLRSLTNFCAYCLWPCMCSRAWCAQWPGFDSAHARPTTKELFLIIPTHMMNREIIPGKKKRVPRCPL